MFLDILMTSYWRPHVIYFTVHVPARMENQARPRPRLGSRAARGPTPGSVAVLVGGGFHWQHLSPRNWMFFAILRYLGGAPAGFLAAARPAALAQDRMLADG